ncbi:MAG: ShlB/FhaC/HecB family hemolysin secretion/activation protein [Woeseiaceae bacterium]
MPEITETPELERKSMLRDINIPDVIDRDPDPESGPRLAVSEFRIQGLAEYPELGITRKALGELVEKIRFDFMAEGKLLESGYTIDELGDLSNLLVDIEEQTTKRHVTPIEVQKLVWLIRGQRAKRGITLGQIETIADKITRFYRERGFILAKAYIPKQEVRDGIVTLTLLLGMLGDVSVNNNKIYSSSKLKSVFDDMLTKPVTSKAVEENLYLINDFPGIIVNGYFEPGYQVGDTKLTINVKHEDKTNANIRLDNHGTKSTGKNRVYADIQVNNLLGNADLLGVSVLNTSEPNNTQYWRVHYDTYLFSPRLKFGLGTSKNQFLVDKSDLNATVGIHGEVEITDATLKYQITRSRIKNSSLTIKNESIYSDLQIGQFIDVNNKLDDKLNNTSIIYNYDLLNEKKKVLHQGQIKYTSGEFIFGAEDGQDKQYSFLNVDYTRLSFVKVPFTESTSRLIMRVNVQYSGKPLPTVSRFSLAGPTKARGYASDIYSTDDAVFIGVDWLFNSPDIFNFNLFSDVNFQKLAKPFVFVDAAYGIQYSINPSESAINGQLLNAGVGIQLSHKNFSGNMHFAVPISKSFSSDISPAEDENVRVIFDFQYKF